MFNTYTPKYLTKYLYNLFHIYLFFKRFYLFILERGGEGEREGEKHQCVVASRAPPTGTWPATQACALEWELNWWTL